MFNWWHAVRQNKEKLGEAIMAQHHPRRNPQIPNLIPMLSPLYYGGKCLYQFLLTAVTNLLYP
jgi:hypothetical protein